VSSDHTLEKLVVESLDVSAVARHEPHEQPDRDGVDRRTSVVLPDNPETREELINIGLAQTQVKHPRSLGG
jgi:hypothetical protein